MRVSIYGLGQVAQRLAGLLADVEQVEVLGPYGRSDRELALAAGADVVAIATTSFLSEIGADVRLAVENGSNVITTAEEAAFPWAVDEALAHELDTLARQRGVSVLGTGLNPGFVFDALVLTAAGACAHASAIRVQRVVDLSGFSATVLARIGVGHSRDEFEQGVASGAITGHIGFVQSMRVVADALGLELERVQREIEPIYAEREHVAPHLTVAPGSSAGFDQRYVGIVDGEPWFEATFTGHVDLAAIGREPSDEITIAGPTPLQLELLPGLDPRMRPAAILANSVRRLIDAPAGWLTVAQLPPATPVASGRAARARSREGSAA
jgi:4-hydroxy-tetrahydrodipicolinate reductase